MDAKTREENKCWETRGKGIDQKKGHAGKGRKVSQRMARSGNVSACFLSSMPCLEVTAGIAALKKGEVTLSWRSVSGSPLNNVMCQTTTSMAQKQSAVAFFVIYLLRAPWLIGNDCPSPATGLGSDTRKGLRGRKKEGSLEWKHSAHQFKSPLIAH